MNVDRDEGKCSSGGFPVLLTDFPLVASGHGRRLLMKLLLILRRVVHRIAIWSWRLELVHLICTSLPLVLGMLGLYVASLNF